MRGEQIILFIQKTRSKNELKNHKVLIRVFEKKEKPLEEQKAFLVSQKIFKKYNNFLM